MKNTIYTTLIGFGLLLFGCTGGESNVEGSDTESTAAPTTTTTGDIDYDEMAKEPRLGGLCQAAAARIKAKEGNYFVSNAQAQTEWLDSEAMQKALVATNFDMGARKWGKASLYLALPSKYLKQHGNFLRLFVRTAIDVMQEERNGQIRCNDCLFFLDEMYALGRIDEIAESAGLMAGYGLRLWPIWQNIGQITKLYGPEGPGTFFGSSDLHQFFGNMDRETLTLISEKVGNYSVSDLPPEPVYIRSAQTAHYGKLFDEEDKKRVTASRIQLMEHYSRQFEASRQLDEQDYRERLAQFQTDASRVLGKPRLPPDEIARVIKKPEKGPSTHCICFVHGGEHWVGRLWPYYIEHMPDIRKPAPTAQSHGFSPGKPAQTKPAGFWKRLLG